MSVTFQQIQKQAQELAGHVVRTPCIYSRTLSHMTGAEVYLKCENLQFTGSFKDRGSWVKLRSLSPTQQQAGVIAMSAGNHAQAVAYHAQQLNIPALIVMPQFTSSVKVEQTRSFGAEIVMKGETLDDTSELTHQLARDRGLQLIHPYDDEHIITGQGSVALEMLEDVPTLDVLVVPVGGGGLIAGSAITAKGVRAEIDIIGVQTERFPSMQHTLEGKPVTCGRSTIADGIAIKQPGNLTRPIVQELVEEILLVQETRIEEAILLLLQIEKTVVEGAGAVGLAALLRYPEKFEGKKVGIIVSGGNMDLLTLSSVIQRGLVRTGRLVRLQVEMRDIPGSLAEVSQCISETEANVIEVHHQRAFTNLPLQIAEVELVLLTRGMPHVHQVMDALSDRGYKPRLMYVDPPIA